MATVYATPWRIASAEPRAGRDPNCCSRRHEAVRRLDVQYVRRLPEALYPVRGRVHRDQVRLRGHSGPHRSPRRRRERARAVRDSQLRQPIACRRSGADTATDLEPTRPRPFAERMVRQRLTCRKAARQPAPPRRRHRAIYSSPETRPCLQSQAALTCTGPTRASEALAQRRRSRRAPRDARAPTPRPACLPAGPRRSGAGEPR